MKNKKKKTASIDPFLIWAAIMLLVGFASMLFLEIYEPVNIAQISLWSSLFYINCILIPKCWGDFFSNQTRATCIVYFWLGLFLDGICLHFKHGSWVIAGSFWLVLLLFGCFFIRRIFLTK